MTIGEAPVIGMAGTSPAMADKEFPGGTATITIVIRNRSTASGKGSPARYAGEPLGGRICRSRSVTALTTSIGRARMAAAVPRSAVRAIVAVAIVRAIVAVPLSVGRALVAAHVLAAPPVGCPHASPAGATIRRVALVITVSIRATIVRSVRTTIVRSMLEPPAVEPVGTGSHAVGAASRGPFVATANMRRTAAASARPTAASAVLHGRRTQRRSGRGNRRGSQCNRYLAHHDAHSVCSEHPSLSESNSAVPIELQRAAQSLGVLASESEPQKIEAETFASQRGSALRCECNRM